MLKAYSDAYDCIYKLGNETYSYTFSVLFGFIITKLAPF